MGLGENVQAVQAILIREKAPTLRFGQGHQGKLHCNAGDVFNSPATTSVT
jgi:hypothetical protein